MKDKCGQDFLVEMRELLKENRVDTSKIVIALELICTNYGFDNALIFEREYTKKFLLTESYSKMGSDFSQYSFEEEDILKIQEGCIKEGCFYIQKNSVNSQLQPIFFDRLKTEKLLFAPIIHENDESKDIFAFLLFYNLSDNKFDDEIDTISLEIAIFMLIQYINSRIYEKKVKRNKTILEHILDNTGIDIYVNDFYKHDILYVNKSMAEPYGGVEAFKDKKCWEVLFPGQSGPCKFCPAPRLIDKQGNPSKIYSWDYQRPFDGEWFRVFSAAFCWTDGRLAHVVSSANISENKKNEAMIEDLANYDQLTKLPNRRMLLKECERRIDKSTANEKGYVMFFDIDNFKSINDNLGHDSGDEFLIQLGQFFTSIPLLKGSIFRNGGDEFVAIVGGETVSKDNIKNLASFIHMRFKKGWKLNNGEVYCNTSIGVSCYPEDGITAEVLLQKADQAMYHVKKNGGGAICFGYQLTSTANEELS